MATTTFGSIPASQTNGIKDHKLTLFEYQPDNDWTRAIHHQLNIRRRTCNTFIPNPAEISDSKNRDDIKCGCKRFRREHSWDVFEDNRTKWDQKQHTISACNNAYGHLLRTHAPYIRCDIETDPKLLAQLMFEVWKVKEPQLIICIIGGAKYFKLNERLEKEFIKGIIQAALKADGWIVTTGFKTGVVQLVGEAIHDHKVTNPGSHITAIGCSKWGGVKNRESLILKKAAGNINLDASMSQPKPEKSQQDLEPNHTHFLLLDDGTYYGYNIGDYRTRFVIEASNYQKKDIPIVTIVLEGGPDTLSTICRDLRACIPVVLIDGSGRVPNLLAKFLARTEAMINRSPKVEDGVDWEQEIDNKEKNDIEKLTKKFNSYADEIRSGLNEIEKGDKKDKKSDSLFNDFLYCLQPAVRSRIRVYSLDSDHDLDDTIFEAIIQVKGQKNSDGENKSNKEQLLKLALAWDAIEVAKEYIIKDDLSYLNKETKEKLFLEALRQDRPQFINAFIKLNFNVSEMFYKRETNKPWQLIWGKLSALYNEDYTKDKELRLFGKCRGKKETLSPQELDQILRKLIGDYMKSIYTHSPEGAFGKLQVCCRCPQGGRVADSRAHLYRDDDENYSEAPDPEEANKEARELVYRDLFLWAILTNRIKMCKVIMSFMQTRICAALIASKVMKSYQKLAHDNELKDKLFTRANEFEEYAIESLQWCYTYHEDRACEIAIRSIHLFGGVTCLQVAVDADDKNFVGQPCCDQLLNNVWYNKMEPLQSSFSPWFGILLSIFTFGILAPVPKLVAFRKEESSADDFPFDQKETYEMTVNQTKEEDEEEMRKKLLPRQTKRLRSYGVSYSDTYMWRSNYCPQGLLNYFHRLKQFHESPFIKFVYNAASYIFFLLLFSYYLLFAFHSPTDETPSINWTEILVIIIVSTMLMEDIRQFLCQENRSILGKFYNYFIQNSLSGGLRVACYLLFYIGLILRFTYADDSDQLSVAKIILAYDLEIWFIRSLVFLGVARKMGPKLVMIRKMVIDLCFFIYIILIAMIGYGVASRSMYDYTGDSDNSTLTFDGRSIFRHILYPTYYLMYGSMDGELGSLDQNPNASTAIATQVLLAFHMLFVNILLINLLIAMFSYTFQSVQEQTDLVWRYERYSLVREYFERPPLFPPFIIFTHMIEIIKLILRHLPNSKLSNMSSRRAKTFKMIGANGQIDKEWSEFESYATNLYARTVVSGQPSSVAVHAPSITQQDSSQTTSDTANIPQFPPNVDVKAITDEMSSIKRSIGDLRTYAEEMNRCMQWMMDAMERVKMSREPKPRLRSALTTSDLNPTFE